MSPDHIENSAYCLCEDCTQGYRLATPRVRGQEDISYALEKMRREIDGTAGWSDADYRAALRAVGVSSTPQMVPVVPVCCPECGDTRIEPWLRDSWLCTAGLHEFTPVAAVHPDWKG